MQLSNYKPNEYEAEKASHAYLMALVVFIVGLPIPILNLLASLIFFLFTRRSSYFVRWHVMQTLVAQVVLFILNNIAFWITIGILFMGQEITNFKIAYGFTLLIFNLIDIVSMVLAAVRVRRGLYLSWFFFGDLTNFLVSSKKEYETIF